MASFYGRPLCWIVVLFESSGGEHSRFGARIATCDCCRGSKQSEEAVHLPDVKQMQLINVAETFPVLTGSSINEKKDFRGT